MRVILLAIAIASACTAIFIQHWKVLPTREDFVTSGIFRCSLLPETVSIYDIQAAVGTLEFQGAVGARISVDEISGEPQQFQLSSHHLEQSGADDGLEQAVTLLELKLKSLAVSEVEASRAYVDELRTEARERVRNSSSEPAAAEPALKALSAEDDARVRLLRQESAELRGFLKGGEKPSWLAARLDRPSVASAQAKVDRNREELLRLTARWTARNRAVQAQSQSLEKARADLLALEKHLAKIMLASYEAELQRLEEKDLAIVKSNVERTAPKPTSTEADLDEPNAAATWLKEHSYKLDLRAKELQKKASLSRISGPQTVLVQPVGYWTVMALWCAALLSLLGALFLPSQRRPNLAMPFQPSDEGSSVPPKLGPTNISLSAQTEPSPVQPLRYSPHDSETFFNSFRHQIEGRLGRSPSCILILGPSKNSARSSLTLRLAKNFSNARYAVKLIDFDLNERHLSQRIGDENSPGVTDLLKYSGPAEEFFASVPGTQIQFAPAGTYRAIGDLVCQDTLKTLLRCGANGVTLVDASFDSPLHVLLCEIDTVLCLTRPGVKWGEQEQQVLLAFREAGLPIWGVAHGDSQIYPFI